MAEIRKVFIMIFLLQNTFLYGDIAERYYANEKKKLLETIVQEVKNTRSDLGKEKLNPRVMDALGSVPRHKFVPFYLRVSAYENRPLPIGHGQTISQPYIVAIMTDLLDPKPSDRVLEIGTGSGYQAAVLAKIVKEVYSIEVIEPLGREAATRLKDLGYTNIKSRIGDGYYGWKEHAPYDAIIVTAAAGHIPPPLLKQLKPGGKMIIPVASFAFVQQLVLVQKDRDGVVTARQIMPVAFVPLTRSP